MNDYDKTCRRLARLTVAVSFALIAWLMRKCRLALEFVRWMDTRTIPWPGQPDRTCDTVARLKPTDADGPPWTFPLEFETDPDADAAEMWKGHLEDVGMKQSALMEECRNEGRQEAILRLLGKRFHETPEDLRARVRAIKDPAQLDALLDYTVDCESLEDFSRRLPPANGQGA